MLTKEKLLELNKDNSKFTNPIIFLDRAVVVVNLPDGSEQPFYQSTGRNSDCPGEWFPFYGYLEGLAYPFGWFVKPDFYHEGGSYCARYGNNPTYEHVGELLKELFSTGMSPRRLQPHWVFSFNRWIGWKDSLDFNKKIRAFRKKYPEYKALRDQLKQKYYKGLSR